MIAKKLATVVGASMLSVAFGAKELTSERTFVFLRPETSSFWHTAKGNSVTVPIDCPDGATSATLEVAGIGYEKTYGNLPGGSFTFTLPAADSPSTENVYDLTLTFDDGTIRTAKIGLINGVSTDAEGATRCLLPANDRKWNKVVRQAVLPIPYGMTSFTVDGQETETGLKGAQGWFAIGPVEPKESVSLSLSVAGSEYLASLLGGGSGLMLLFK